MSTNAPFQCYASHIMQSLPSIPENDRKVCIWIRCVNIEHQFSIARNQWSEQQFLKLTTAGLWDVCQFIVVYNHKYKKSVQQKHIGRVMIWQAAHLHPYYIMTVKGVIATASRLHTHELYTNALTVYIYIYKTYNPITGLDRPSWFQEVKAPRFHDSWHMKIVRLSPLYTDRLYPPGNIPGTHIC